MSARVFVESPSAYQSWLSTKAGSDLGKNEWSGVCAKCHGPQGEGDYGPAISTNGLLIQPDGLRTLLENGQNRTAPISSYMPPVARGWSDKQFAALDTYLKQSVYKAAPSGG
jgi:cytochrome c553